MLLTRSLGLWLTLAAAASAAALDPNNTTGSQGVLLVDKLGAHIRFLDPVNLKEISNIEVGVNPHDVALSPDHKFAYIPIYGDGVYGRNPHPGHEIAIIDLTTRKQSGTIDISPYIAPHGIQVDRDGMVYVTCDLSRKLLVVNPKTQKIDAAIDTEGTGHWVAVLPDRSKAYVANKADKLFVTVIDLKKRTIVARIPTPKGSQGIAASPDGKRVAVVDLADPVLVMIDTATDKVVDFVPLDESAGRASFKPKFSPDGSTLLVCKNGPQGTQGMAGILSTADLHKGQLWLMVGKDPMGFGFAADGKIALVANHGDGTVSVIDLSLKRVTKYIDAGKGIESIAYY
jgi:YVTN family beta-propeller protein